MRVVAFLVFAGCNHSTAPGDPGSSSPAGADVSVPLGPGEARAGTIQGESALFAGISSEGRVGDLKIYNQYVQFVVQGLRTDGAYYIPDATGIVDADIVRPAGQLGRDSVDEWGGMYGVGRLEAADTVVVVDDGEESGTAIIHTEGYETPMTLITGALEAPGFIPTLGIRISTDYILPADSWLLEVKTTISAGDSEADILPGDVLMGSFEVIDPWEPGVGLDAPSGTPVPWKGYIGKHNDVALGIFAPLGTTLSTAGLDAILSSAQLSAGFGDIVAIPPGGTATWDRYYGVGPDLATLSGAYATLTGEQVRPVSGTVTAPDGPVAGARVNVLVDGEPYTLAVTGPDGSFHADVPQAGQVSYLADGRSPGVWPDLGDGAGNWCPYAAESLHQAVLASYDGAADALPLAAGRGVGGGPDGLSLGEPGWITVHSADSPAFEVRLSMAAGDPVEVDERLAEARPYGYQAVAWARDGSVRFPVEPGTYSLLAWRGITAEVHQEDVTVAAGQELSVEAPLPTAYTHDGWLLGDPHMHGSPSSDTQITMEDRLVTAAATGVQLHFGTDHDHIADYRPLIAPLGLDGVLTSVVADEVSPVLRGHLNVYPLQIDPTQSNNGAWPWYSSPVASTSEEFSILRERHGDFILQSNHPLTGLASYAGWQPGKIGKGDHWDAGFDAVEALNGGSNDHSAFYLDIVQRGLRPAPVGVSDSHSHLGGNLGGSATWISFPGGQYSDEALKAAMRARATVVTRGPFLETSLPPGQDVVGADTEVTVTARGPSWIQVDQLELWKDGVVVETVAGSTATFALSPEKDAVYLVFAEGSQPMQPVFDATPWAMTSAWFVDVDGDGFTPPAPPLEVTE